MDLWLTEIAAPLMVVALAERQRSLYCFDERPHLRCTFLQPAERLLDEPQVVRRRGFVTLEPPFHSAQRR